MSKRKSERSTPCIRCGERPIAVKLQFRGNDPWAGLTGWRVFCNGGLHHAAVPIRRHKADAIADWNKLQVDAAATGNDPAKSLWNWTCPSTRGEATP